MPTSRNRKKKKKAKVLATKKSFGNNQDTAQNLNTLINDLINSGNLEDSESFEQFKKVILKMDKKESNERNTFQLYASNHKTADIFNCLTGIQLIPVNHGKNLRIEMMAVIALKNINSNSPVKLDEIQKSIKESYPSFSMEDPPEGLYTESVLFHGGNYVVMPGIVSRAGDIFRAMSESIFILPNDLSAELKEKIRQGVTLLLEFGNYIFKKSALNVNMYTEAENNSIVLPDSREEYSLSIAEFEKLCTKFKVSQEVSLDLILDHKDPRLLEDDYDLNPMLYHPLIIIEDRIYFPLISAQLMAINEFIIRSILKSGSKLPFLKDYNALLYNDVLMACKSMGWGLTDIQLPELSDDYGVKEAVLAFDRDKLCYLIFKQINDITDKYDEAKNPPEGFKEGNLDQSHSKRVEKVLDFFHSEKRFEGTEFFVFYVVGDIGRASYSTFQKTKYDVEVSWMAAFTLILLAKTEDWNPLSLYKYARVYRELTETTELMTLDPIDSYSTYKSKDDSFYLSDDYRPDFLTIAPGTGADVFREAKLKRDLKGQLTIYGKDIGYELVERFREYESIYKLAHVDRTTTLLVDSYAFPIWVVGKFQDKQQESFYKMVVEAIAVWLDKVSGPVKGMLTDFEFPVLILNIILDEHFFRTYTVEELNSASLNGDFENALSAKGIIEFKVPGFILRELQGPDNRGERQIILNLLKAINLTLPGKIDPLVFQRILDEYMPLGPAKMILILNSESDFRYDGRWLIKKHLLTSAEINLLLDHLPEIIKYPGKIPKQILGKDEKSAFCNHIVKSLLDHLKQQVDNFSDQELITLLIEINEALIHSNAQEMVRVPAQVFCFGDKDGRVEKLMNDELQSVKTALSIRCLLEYLAAIPAIGKRVPGYDDVDRLLAIMNEIINFGMVSDAIRFSLDDPEIGLLNSGRIGISKSFYDEKLKPFAHASTLADVEGYMEHFNDMFDSLEKGDVDISIQKSQWEKIDEAFETDWGVSFTEILGFLRLLTVYGVSKDTSIVKIRKVDFKAYLLNNGAGFTLKKVDSLLNLLSLTTRDKFLTAPDGFKNDDVFPWKYNREFSLIRRPIIEYKNEDNIAFLIWGIRCADVASRQINQLFWNGRLKYGNERIAQLLGDRNKELGDKFRQEAFRWLNQHKNLQVFDYEVKIDVNGPLKADKNYGDIDILAFDRESKTVFNIECKRTHQAKNIHEMKTELDSYMGRDGQKKKIQKHVDRHNWLIQNQDKLVAFLKTEGPLKIKSFLLTSEVVPVKYIVGLGSPLPLISYAELKGRGLASLEDLVQTNNVIISQK